MERMGERGANNDRREYLSRLLEASDNLAMLLFRRDFPYHAEGWMWLGSQIEHQLNDQNRMVDDRPDLQIAA